MIRNDSDLTIKTQENDTWSTKEFNSRRRQQDSKLYKMKFVLMFATLIVVCNSVSIPVEEKLDNCKLCEFIFKKVNAAIADGLGVGKIVDTMKIECKIFFMYRPKWEKKCYAFVDNVVKPQLEGLMGHIVPPKQTCRLLGYC
ncbi:unnamed protein product [Lepeophtheirus salmonis]|uniref:(salmon louse) hypothetical protein n=1 Tax=Lepeophtheirus salmonis TaxID=72036 RepID=A0A7R8CBX4_LEPSM|nr:unnamed protein product [Lepeophtheirus salmonis]CAF2760388.1 unnamed protein product [Lepeophtheirus salmonis]